MGTLWCPPCFVHRVRGQQPIGTSCRYASSFLFRKMCVSRPATIRKRLPQVYQFWSAKSPMKGTNAQRMRSNAPNTIRKIPIFFFIVSIEFCYNHSNQVQNNDFFFKQRNFSARFLRLSVKKVFFLAKYIKKIRTFAPLLQNRKSTNNIINKSNLHY